MMEFSNDYINFYVNYSKNIFIIGSKGGILFRKTLFCVLISYQFNNATTKYAPNELIVAPLIFNDGIPININDNIIFTTKPTAKFLTGLNCLLTDCRTAVKA